MKISERIKQLRKQAKMSLSQLAKVSGLQLATLSRIEHDKMVGTIETHYRISKALSLSLSDYFKNVTFDFKGKDPMP